MVETILVIYVLYAAVILIWSSSSQPDIQIRYVVISTALLKEGVFPGANPLIIDLRPAQPGTGPAACIPERWSFPGMSSVVWFDGLHRVRLSFSVTMRKAAAWIGGSSRGYSS